MDMMLIILSTKIGKVEAWPVMLAKQELISKFLTSKSMVVDDVFECATI